MIHDIAPIDDSTYFVSLISEIGWLNFELAEKLLERCPHGLNACTKAQLLPLDSIIGLSSESQLAALDWMLDHGADPNLRSPNESRMPLIFSACYSAPIVQRLIDWGVDINWRIFEGKTPLHVAALCGHWTSVRCLLAAGADATLRDNKNRTALLVASNFDVLQEFVAAGVDLDVRGGSFKETVLHTFAGRGDVAAVKMLLMKGISTERRTIEGRTARQLAIHMGHGEVVKVIDAFSATEEARQAINQAVGDGFSFIKNL